MMISLTELTLPNWRVPVTSSITETYLLPQLMPEQNPDPKSYWSCPVYAKTDVIEKTDPKGTSRRGKSIGPMRSSMGYSEVEPYSYLHPSEAGHFEHVIAFFGDQAFPGVVAMRIPNAAEYYEAWDLCARCYESSDGLTMKAPWEEWRASIQNLPEDVTRN
ncbi:hypothetical protein FB446DRAFT_377394 [Lentinula raphanica]|nr:hypothetical protein FB446DRAFT_377394 [Lentinula raphanica]